MASSSRRLAVHYALTDGSGALVGKGDTANPGDDGEDSGQIFQFWIDWKWIKPDGSVGATMRQSLTACNEEEYIAAVQRLGGSVPTRSR